MWESYFVVGKAGIWHSVSVCRHENLHKTNLSLSLSAVGLLQACFTSGPLSQLSQSPRPFLSPLSRASPGVAESPRPLHWAGQGPSSFPLASRTPEPSVRTVGVRRLGGPIPLKESVSQGKVGILFVSCTTPFSKQLGCCVNIHVTEWNSLLIFFDIYSIGNNTKTIYLKLFLINW